MPTEQIAQQMQELYEELLADGEIPEEAPPEWKILEMYRLEVGREM